MTSFAHARVTPHISVILHRVQKMHVCICLKTIFTPQGSGFPWYKSSVKARTAARWLLFHQSSYNLPVFSIMIFKTRVVNPKFRILFKWTTIVQETIQESRTAYSRIYFILNEYRYKNDGSRCYRSVMVF